MVIVKDIDKGFAPNKGKNRRDSSEVTDFSKLKNSLEREIKAMKDTIDPK